MNDSLNTVSRYYIVKQQLTQQILDSNARGTTLRENTDPKLVVSLTTHGKRIFTAPFAIESIFSQTYKADRVVLYLSKDEFSEQALPVSLKRQKERGLEIRFVEDIGPHTKLIPAMKDFPDAVIVTVDDDYMYPFDLLERLVSTHLSHPGAVCCFQSRIIKQKALGELKPYNSFEMCFPDKDFRSHSLLAEGFGGILYPPHSLPEKAFDFALIKELAPYADDLWFKSMELLAGTPVVQIARNKYWFNTITSEPIVQDSGLKNYNNDKSGNDVQLKKLFSHFNLYDRIQ